MISESLKINTTLTKLNLCSNEIEVNEKKQKYKKSKDKIEQEKVLNFLKFYSFVLFINFVLHVNKRFNNKKI